VETERNMQRIFITGNGGSGKSWLALRLAETQGLTPVHLDDLHWLANFAGERPRDERTRMVDEIAQRERWIMEGIYGSILKQVFARVTTLVWLDIADDECLANLQQRGQTGGGTPEQFAELLDYTRGYRDRRNHLNSFEAHQWFFEQHPMQKYRLKNRAEMTAFLDDV
jgi:adenylate kinase family enzyme